MMDVGKRPPIIITSLYRLRINKRSSGSKDAHQTALELNLINEVMVDDPAYFYLHHKLMQDK